MKPVSCQFNRLKINSERKTLNKYIDVLSANYQLICFLLRLRRREQCSRRNCRHSSELITNRNEKNKTKQKQKQKQKTKTTQFHFLSTRSIERTRNNLVAPTFRAPPVQMRALDLHARPNKQVDRTMSNRRRQQQRRQRRRASATQTCLPMHCLATALWERAVDMPHHHRKRPHIKLESTHMQVFLFLYKKIPFFHYWRFSLVKSCR